MATSLWWLCSFVFMFAKMKWIMKPVRWLQVVHSALSHMACVGASDTTRISKWKNARQDSNTLSTESQMYWLPRNCKHPYMNNHEKWMADSFFYWFRYEIFNYKLWESVKRLVTQEEDWYVDAVLRGIQSDVTKCDFMWSNGYCLDYLLTSCLKRSRV